METHTLTVETIIAFRAFTLVCVWSHGAGPVVLAWFRVTNVSMTFFWKHQRKYAQFHVLCFAESTVTRQQSFRACVRADTHTHTHTHARTHARTQTHTPTYIKLYCQYNEQHCNYITHM